MFKFGIPNPDWLPGLPISKHFKIFMPGANEGEWIGRMYTPVSPLNQKGTIDFVIKCYPQTEEHPEGGKMGQYLITKNVGDKLRMEGPMGRLTYLGNGVINRMKKEDARFTKVVLLGGGSGLTPLYSFLNAIYLAKDPAITYCHLIYSNKTEADMLMREELDAINADASAPHLRVTHTLTRESADKTFPDNVLRGRINIEMLQSLQVPAPGEDVIFIGCGPQAFNESNKALLLAAGYDEN